MRAQADAVAAATGSKVDVVLMMPHKDVVRLTPDKYAYLKKHGIKLVEVPWTIPPSLRWRPRHWIPATGGNWCGPQDLMRLHVLGWDQYDAVAFYDQDIEFHGDVGPVLRCASTGYFLSTSGGIGEPLNVGFFAVRPDRRLLRAAERFAANASFNESTGWANAGHAPARGYFVGAECGQGFFHTLFYKRAREPVRRAWAAAGLPAAGAPGSLKAAQLDQCIWNYQTSNHCPRLFDCGSVRAHHKPTGKPGGRDCPKLALRPKKPAAPALGERSAARCEQRLVHVGAQCKCDGTPSVKTITVPGHITHCEQRVCDPSGDAFLISFEGSTLTATRADKDSCWCDEAVDVRCCVVPPSAGPSESGPALSGPASPPP